MKHLFNTNYSESGIEDVLTSKRVRDFTITDQVYGQIRSFIGCRRAEQGGMLGMTTDGVVRYFAEDPSARTSSAAYDPDIPRMNRIIEEWKEKGIRFIGFVHSHPPGYTVLSSYDKWYAGEILKNFEDHDFLWLPVVQTIPDTGSFTIFSYCVLPGSVYRDKITIEMRELKIINYVGKDVTDTVIDPTWQIQPEPSSVTSIEMPDKQRIREEDSRKDSETVCKGKQCQASEIIGLGRYHGVQKELWEKTKGKDSGEVLSISTRDIHFLHKFYENQELHNKFLQRLSLDYDLSYLGRTRLIVVGTGGFASGVLNAARMGIGEYILIDPDEVSHTNIGTQFTRPASIGKAKVEALGKEVAQLNPISSVLSFHKGIEEFSDEDFSQLLEIPLHWKNDSVNKRYPGNSTDVLSWSAVRPLKTILLGMTDNFQAQARVHRLGLKFGIPTVCAMQYKHGIGAEVTYTVPGITPACHRCITSSRYVSYLEKGFQNDVTSDGAPIYAAECLNSVIGHMLLAIVHHGTSNKRYGQTITKLGDHNLILIKMDPSFDDEISPAFKNRLSENAKYDLFPMLNTIFLPQDPDYGQTPDRPRCPDCGGTGDLTQVKYKNPDTKEMKPYKR